MPPKITRKYLVLPSAKDSRFPEGLVRPLLHVGIYYPPTGRKIRFLALIDSGADLSVAPGDVAVALGIDFGQGEPHRFRGIHGPPVLGYAHEVVLDVANYGLEVKMVFFPAERNYLVLGQRGLFDSFRVLFDRPKGIFEIEPACALPPFGMHPKVRS
jgi:hypothetical protein